MAGRIKRGATRKPVRKVRQPVAWQQTLRHMVLAVMVLGIVSGGVYLHQEDTLPIVHVTVEGAFTHVDKEALVAEITNQERRGMGVMLNALRLSLAGSGDRLHHPADRGCPASSGSSRRCGRTTGRTPPRIPGSEAPSPRAHGSTPRRGWPPR